MGFFKSVARAFKSVEKAVLGNDIVKVLDPASYFIYNDVQKQVGGLATMLGGALQPTNDPPSSATAAKAVSDEATIATAKKKQVTAAGKRQGSGATGSQMLADDTNEALGSSTLLGL